MSHPANAKNKYKVINQQMAELARIISQLSNLYMIIESDMRELKQELREKGVISETQVTQVEDEKHIELEKVEADAAKTEDYFPHKADDTKTQVVDSTGE